MPYLCKLRGQIGHGNEISPGAIAVAKDLFKVELDYGQFEDLALLKNYYGGVVFHHGIEHVIHPYKALQQAVACLKPGGRIYLSHPVMRDFEWVKEYGLSGHRHEWTFNAFEKLVRPFYETLWIERSVRGEFNGPGVAQYWVLRKR